MGEIPTESQSARPRRHSGEFPRTLDDKNRVAIPSRWQDERVKALYALPDLNEPCLKLVDDDEMERMYRRIEASPDLTPDKKKLLKDRYFSRAVECPLDKQGRIVIPQSFVDRYQFRALVTLAGVADCITVWRPEDREATNDETELANLVRIVGI